MDCSYLKKGAFWNNASSGIVFFCALFFYWLTVDPSASYWDCPEYITCASRLEVGHPPGNPVWMLAMRFVTIPFPNHLHPIVINLCSGLFMALAAFFLSRVIFMLSTGVIQSFAKQRNFNASLSPFVSFIASLSGGLAFALCDSAWFSAVEAEVYAMSAFLTSLMVWLMLRWAVSEDQSLKLRIILLLAYLTGLSLGVHQLNLLCIPVLVLIYSLKKYKGKGAVMRIITAILISFAAVALILTGIMPGVLSWAMEFELLAVNRFGMPYFSGVLIYPALLTVMAICTLLATRGSKFTLAILLFLFIWLSGLFVFTSDFILGGILSLAIAAGIVWLYRQKRVFIESFVWGLSFILLGYSSFALIIIRGYASPPMNEADPTDIFALSSYVARDQYGSKPLLYGATPYSTPLMEERWEPERYFPDYSRYVLKKGKPKRYVALPDAHINHRSRMVSARDSVENSEIMSKGGDGYILSDYAFTRVTTPELDMFFPRITGTSASDISSYEEWAGMSKETMNRVKISEAIDSSGNYVNKIGLDGERGENFSYRPTYWQNLKFLLSYQLGYMYFRYLLWNFVGRQNDMPSTGEIDHGNFITGIPFIDTEMLGDQSAMPPNASYNNPGRHNYFGIPFLIGLLGFSFLFFSGKNGRKIQAIVSLLFFMTGPAIVIYLNQSPGEPRERDYSFLGSYMAFAIWIGIAIVAVGIYMMKHGLVKKWTITGFSILGLGIPSLMCVENFPDHDRSGRSEPYRFASNLLLSEPPAIIFTQGDNFTFPMWFSQEVMNTGSEHTVIDMSYFAVPEYVINLTKQGKRGLSLTASEADIAYGAFAYTRIAPDADTIPVPAMQMLRELYDSKESTPVIRHRKVFLPGKNNSDTLTVDLRNMSNGSSLLPFRKLMLLDLIATNQGSENPRPIYFLASLPKDTYKDFLPALRRMPYVIAYEPGLSDSAHMERLVKMTEIPLNEANRIQTAYIDPVIAEQYRRQRGEMIIAGKSMIEAGDTAAGAQVVVKATGLYPYNRISPGSFTLADTTFHEGIEFVMLMNECAKTLGNREMADMAEETLDTMLQESLAWRLYYHRLPQSRRQSVSNQTRRLISIIPRLKQLKVEMARKPE